MTCVNKKESLFLYVKKLWDIQLFRFFLMGGVNVIFSYSIFALLLLLSLHYTLACFLGTILSVIFNFKITGHVVFKNTNNALLFKYIGVYAVIFILNVIGLAIFNSFHISNYIAGAILILPMALVAYILNKSMVF